MGHPTPSTGRRSADSTACSPRCIACGCRPNAAAAACLIGSGRQPYRPRRCPSAAAPSPDWIPSARCSPWPGGSPGYHESTSPPRQSGSTAGCCQVVREVSEGSRRPSAVSGAPPSPPNCFDAPRTWLWTSGLAPARPSHATMGRHLCAAYCTASSAHHQRRVFSSPCRQRVRTTFSAPVTGFRAAPEAHSPLRFRVVPLPVAPVVTGARGPPPDPPGGPVPLCPPHRRR